MDRAAAAEAENAAMRSTLARLWRALMEGGGSLGAEALESMAVQQWQTLDADELQRRCRALEGRAERVALMIDPGARGPRGTA